jgi:hypothetical protein
MKIIIEKCVLVRFAIFVTLVGLLLVSGCARYARNSDTLYEPATTVSGGSGKVYIVIPESQVTQSPDMKRVIGAVSDGENKKIDDIFSSRSPAEIIQAALGLEFKKAGYTAVLVSKRPTTERRVIDLTKTEIKLDQISDLTNIKVTCQVLMGMDVYLAGQLTKRLQYEATHSNTDIKDRDLLAGKVLQDALQSVMLQAIPELHNLFNR